MAKTKILVCERCGAEATVTEDFEGRLTECSGCMTAEIDEAIDNREMEDAGDEDGDGR